MAEHEHVSRTARTWLELLDSTPLVQWFCRGLIVLATLAFLHVFPTMLFVVYMGSYGFFDYAFFREGLFAIGVFYGTAELLLIIASLMMFGAVIPAWGWWRQRQRSGQKLQAVLFGIVNCSFLGTVVLAILPSKHASIVDGLVLLTFGLAIALHLAFVVHEPPRRALCTLLGLFFLTGTMVGISPPSVANLLKLGLRVYNVGGDIPIVVQEKAEPSRRARLVFLGPQHAYLIFDGESSISVLERSDMPRLQLPAPRPSTSS